MKLRYYQQDAVESFYKYCRSTEPGENPCIVLPTGAGKTPVAGQIVRDVVTRWKGRVCVVAHVKELLQQGASTLRRLAPDIDVGVYSASLKSRDTDSKVVFAGIQSVYKRAFDLGAFDLIIVDEAHLIPQNSNTMYRRFLADMEKCNPRLRILGLTATAYRLDSGELCGKGNILTDICYEADIPELIAGGYLCKLTTKQTRTKIDTTGVGVRGGEFIPSQLAALVNDEAKVAAACDEIVKATQSRKKILVFCSSIEHAENVTSILAKKSGRTAELLTGETPQKQRARMVEQFKQGGISYLVNVNVLTTGFDAPDVDCVVMLRPTLSPGLYYQMAGRGFRIHPLKQDCLVLDFAGNTARHGPVDRIRSPEKKGSEGGEAPTKTCPECAEIVSAAARRCYACGFEFPPPEIKHETRPGQEAILSQEVEAEPPAWVSVDRVYYSVHTKRDAPEGHPRTLRVDYRCGMATFSEWVCVEHDGFAGRKARKWWKSRSENAMPDDADQAEKLASGGALAVPEEIQITQKPGEKYQQITDYRIYEIPLAVDPSLASAFSQGVTEDDIPF